MKARSARMRHLTLAASVGQAPDGAAWLALGVASLRHGDAAAARIQFAQAVAMLPSSVPAWLGLGWSCVLLQDFTAAVAAFRPAIRLDDWNADTQGSAAVALWLAGRREEAQPHATRAEQLDPQDRMVRVMRALREGGVRDVSVLAELAVVVLRRRKRQRTTSAAPGKA